MRKVTAYTHPNPTASEQVADTKPGVYYVSVRKDNSTRFLLGPFRSHQSALDVVDTGKGFTYEADPLAPFYSYGTCRIENDETKPLRHGIFNIRFFGEQAGKLRFPEDKQDQFADLAAEIAKK